MLKTFMTMVVVAVIFYSGQVFAQSQGSDSIPVIIHTDSIGGVKVEYDEYGNVNGTWYGLSWIDGYASYVIIILINESSLILILINESSLTIINLTFKLK